MSWVLATGSFDDLRDRHVRLLQEAARLGPVRVGLWSDELVRAATGAEPKFPEAERRYFVEAIRFVDQLSVVDDPRLLDAPPEELTDQAAAWVMFAEEACAARRAYAAARGLALRPLDDHQLAGYPDPAPGGPPPTPPGVKKVIVTGCYDWLHSGHVRFFEEVSQLGQLHVVVGHDENIRLLKGEGHPMFPAEQRRYMVAAVRYVAQALISSGRGWLDAEPEIQRIQPDIYAVNEDGDRPEKRAYCEANGIEYVVLKRKPKEGLPRRESTRLRGF